MIIKPLQIVLIAILIGLLFPYLSFFPIVLFGSAIAVGIIVLQGIKEGTRSALAVCGISTLVLYGVHQDYHLTINYLVLSVFTAFVLLFLHQKGKPAFWGIIITSSSVFFALIAFLFIYSLVNDTTPHQLLGSYLDKQQGEISSILERQINEDSREFKELKGIYFQTRHYFSLMFPGILLPLLMAFFGIQYQIIRLFLERGFGLILNKDSFQAFSMPWYLVFPFIASAFMAISGIKMAEIIGFNMVAICCLFYFLQGLAIVHYYLIKYNLSALVRLLLYILIFSQLATILMISLVGLFDFWIDFRSLDNRIKRKLEELKKDDEQ